MSMSYKIAHEKYKALKNNLENSQDSSQGDGDDTIAIMAELLPLYYRYRSHLVNILQEFPNSKQLTQIPREEVLERLKKCKEISDKKQQNLSKSVTRGLLTQKIIYKNRKKNQENHQNLQDNSGDLSKLQADDQRLSSLDRDNSQERQKKWNDKEHIKIPVKSKQPKQTKLQEYDGRRLSIDGNLHGTQHLITTFNNCESRVHEIPTLDIGSKKKTQQKSRRQSPSNSQKEKIPSKQVLTDRSKKSQVIQKIRNSNLKPSQRQTPELSRLSSSRKGVPLIRINYQRTPSDSEEEQIQGQNHVMKNSIKSYVQKKSKFGMKSSNNFDTFSMKNGTNKFFEIQNKKLQKQKILAEKLHREVSEVLSSTCVRNQLNQDYEWTKRKNMEQDTARSKIFNAENTDRSIYSKNYQNYTTNLKFLLSEICQLNCKAECLKFLLKNRQYQILNFLHQNSYRIGNNQIKPENCKKNIQKLLKNQDQSQSSIILEYIFCSKSSLNFETFSERFKSNLENHELQFLMPRLQQKGKSLKQILMELFSVWLQISYFQNKVHKSSQTISITDKLQKIKKTWTGESNLLSLDEIQKFLYSTNRNKNNRIKVSLFFNKICPNKSFGEFLNWLKGKHTK